ncbi:MAG: GNAT family N-acetyltransferase, partial [Clostridia bacterium]|nr:GNAT family N-acetyltransferase [Clostridia bacterium]
MEFVVKEFEQLTTTQLYEILKARCGVFVVEQKMNCQDMDDVDYRSVHIYLQENNDVVAYLRAFFTQESTGEMQIGRCLTVVHGQGLGRKLMEQAIQVLKEQYHCRKIV